MNWVWLNTLVYDVVLIGCSVFAARYGSAAERWALAILWVGGGLTGVLPFARPLLGTHIRAAYLAIDVVALIAFDAIMVRSRKFWPIWVTGIQLAAVALGIAILVSPDLLDRYRLIQGKLAYGLLLAILIGAWRQRGQS